VSRELVRRRERMPASVEPNAAQQPIERSERRVLTAVIPIALAGALVVGGYLAGLFWDFRPDKLTRDLVNFTGSAPYAGSMNSGVIVLWAVIATVFLSTSRFIDQRTSHGEHRFMVAFGCLIGYLGIDDAFVLHDRLYSQHVGLPEVFTLAAYGAVAVTLLISNRLVIVGEAHAYLLVLVGLFFAASIAIDLRPRPQASFLPLGTLEYAEDAMKLVALALLLRYAIAFTASTMQAAHRITSREPTT
jgi:hypothetical protein